MQGRVFCKQLVRLQYQLVASTFNKINGLLLFACFLVKFQRGTFMQSGMKVASRPYFELMNAVRIGDLELFCRVADKYSKTFNTDSTQNLIVQLCHNVIRTGLCNISISYSRISLADVAAKLRLNSDSPMADAESIVAKAFRDRAIDATIDHTNGWMLSKETGDIYSTNEPQLAFNSRIAFCLNMHNEAVKALRFPLNAHKEGERERERVLKNTEKGNSRSKNLQSILPRKMMMSSRL